MSEVNVEHAWASQSRGLASLVFTGMVNRPDVFGTYANGRGTTAKRPVTIQLLEQHFAGAVVIGLHAVNKESLCWWGAIDLDNHDGDEGRAKQNSDEAKTVWTTLR